MEAQRHNEPALYNDVYRHNLDEKRRLQIPSKWRPDSDKFEFTMIVWTKDAAGACLRMLPPSQMERLLADIDRLPPGDPAKTILKRNIGRMSTQVELDKAGRICIPESFASAADITKEAVLVGLLDRFEIWNPARQEKAEAADRERLSEVLVKLD